MPSSGAKRPISAADRALGAVLGSAIGDALGRPVEFVVSLRELRQLYGENGVQGYVELKPSPAGPIAPYTDDTEMAEAVLRGLLDSRKRGLGLDATMRGIAQRFIAWSHAVDPDLRAPGRACMAGCLALEHGVPWREAGGSQEGGCGSVMRAWPFGLVFRSDPEGAAEWSKAHSLLTHGDPMALAACAGLAWIIAKLASGSLLPELIAPATKIMARIDPNSSEMLRAAADDAARGTPPSRVLTRLQGWIAKEALAASVYVALRHQHDYRAGVLEAVNTLGDSDSLGAITGAILGTHLGIASLPTEWIQPLERHVELSALARSVNEEIAEAS